jgi:PKHD-type hydroxylase
MYRLNPPNYISILGQSSFNTWENGFSTDELNKLELYCDSLPRDKATITGKTKDDEYSEIRITETAWINHNKDIDWFYERMAGIVNELNMRFYRFDLTEFQENFQYTVYTAENRSHYAWHIDQSPMTSMARKLSLSVQLSRPDEYSGCDLELMTKKDIDIAPKTRGTVIAFPSYTLHRVTPIRKGTRKALVIWVGGPNFK